MVSVQYAIVIYIKGNLKTKVCCCCHFFVITIIKTTTTATIIIVIIDAVQNDNWSIVRSFTIHIYMNDNIEQVSSSTYFSSKREQHIRSVKLNLKVFDLLKRNRNRSTATIIEATSILMRRIIVTVENFLGLLSIKSK